ncbi:hypothetical protein L7F22_006522 [Adiantum nelumboides]|nr:hypothetical protein [Adiantum nelumboides]
MITTALEMVEVLKQKLLQLWRFLREWSLVNFVRWAFSRLQCFCKLLEKKLLAVKSSRHFSIKRIVRVPDPSSLWSSALRAREPLPTSAPWLNFVLNKGSMHEYIHPYLICFKEGTLHICYCAPQDGPKSIKQDFVSDIIIGSASSDGDPCAKQHTITSFDDLSVTVELQGDIVVPLVRGCPYVTLIFKTATYPTFGSAHKVNKLESMEMHTKHKVFLNNDQIWIIYSSHPLLLELVASGVINVKKEYKGHLRFVLLKGGADAEKVLTEHATTYPVGGTADLSVPFQVTYTWEKVSFKQKPLLMLRLPIHRDMMAHETYMDPSKVGSCVHPHVAYDSIDGKMEAVASDFWVLKTQDAVGTSLHPHVAYNGTDQKMEAVASASLVLKTHDTISTVRWHSIGGIQKAKNIKELETVLRRDMSELMPLPKNVVSAYSHGKFLARVARMAMIAEELGSCLDLLKQARDILSDSLTPWLKGTLGSTAFIYDPKWGGIITDENDRWASQSAKGVYDDVHYTLGYFCYAGAVLSKLDEAWGKAYKSHLYTLVKDYMSTKRDSRKWRDSYVFPKLRYFDLWVLHSWSGDGLKESEDGRKQISSSEAMHAYYAGAMLGSAFKDNDLLNLGLTLASCEIKAAQLLWHIPSSSSVYPSSFKVDNRMVGVLWANKRDSCGPISTVGVHTQTPEMQVFPLLPISEFLFIDTAFARELVDWTSRFSSTLPADTWKSYVYALESLYEANSAVAKKAFTLSYPQHESTTCLSILLWWIYTRKTKQPNSLSEKSISSDKNRQLVDTQ